MQYYRELLVARAEMEELPKGNIIKVVISVSWNSRSPQIKASWLCLTLKSI
jgi:hypothetical protein